MNIVENQTCRIDISKRRRIHDVFHVSLFEKIKFKKEKKISLKFNYQLNDIDIEKNEKFTNEKFWIEIILNNKIYKKNQISNKSYNELKFYYFVQWKNYEKRIWKSIVIVKHLKNIFRKFYTNNSKKNDVNKFTNRRKIRRQIKMIFTIKLLTRKSTFYIWFNVIYNSKFTMHEKLNRVKNIFKDDRSI